MSMVREIKYLIEFIKDIENRRFTVRILYTTSYPMEGTIFYNRWLSTFSEEKYICSAFFGGLQLIRKVILFLKCRYKFIIFTTFFSSNDLFIYLFEGVFVVLNVVQQILVQLVHVVYGRIIILNVHPVIHLLFVQFVQNHIVQMNLLFNVHYVIVGYMVHVNIFYLKIQH